MYYNLYDGILKASDSVSVTPDGRPCANFTAWLDALSQDARKTLGWYPLVIEDKPEGNFRQTFVQETNAIRKTWEAYTPISFPVKLDRDKLRNWLISVGKANWLTEKMAEERFCTFWYSEMCYVKGSYMAELIKQELNITQEQLEAIVAACKI